MGTTDVEELDHIKLNCLNLSVPDPFSLRFPSRNGPLPPKTRPKPDLPCTSSRKHFSLPTSSCQLASPLGLCWSKMCLAIRPIIYQPRWISERNSNDSMKLSLIGRNRQSYSKGSRDSRTDEMGAHQDDSTNQ